MMHPCLPRSSLVEAPVSTHKATTLLDLGRYAEALQALDGLDEDGLTADAHCLRARAYLGLKKTKEAERAAAAARASAPDQEWGYRLGAIIARNQLRPKLADELARQAVSLAPHEPNTHQVRALTAIDLGDVSNALEHSDEMLRLAPHDAMTHYTRGLAQMANECPGDAEDAFRKALSIDPQHAGSMSALADLVAARNPEQAKDLRLSAVRTSPQEAHHRRQLLKRGGVVGGGALFAVGKLGILGKIFAIGAIRSVAGAFGNDAIVAAVLAVVYVFAFALTRVRRWRRRKELPRLMWEGLSAERRNADLLWIAWPAGLVLVGAVLAALLQLASGHAAVRPLLYALICAALLAGCWALRRGDARQLGVGDVVHTMIGTVRFLWQRRSARRTVRSHRRAAAGGGETHG
jgi:tetratricopeptide (TPR) repeat protein